MIESEAIKRIRECEAKRNKSLDLSKLSLTSVPEEITHLFWLEQLNLSNNDIRKISNLEKLEKLKVIGLSTNQIQKIEGIENLTNLEELYLFSNKIEQIQNLENLSSLRSLHLGYNEIDKLEGLNSLFELNLLDISNNKITIIEGLSQLRNLKQLFIYSNRIEKIQGLDNLENLKEINLSGNLITEIEGLEQSINLEILELSSNLITSLDKLSLNPNLKKLDVSYNHIPKISGFDTIVELEELSLSGNFLSHLEGLNKLKQLKHLSLNSNKILKIQGLENTTALTKLNFNNNSISKIEGMSALEKLEVLDISTNNIEIIENLENLTQLKILYLHSNQIRKIEGLSSLNNLSELYLTYNSINKIENIKLLRSLKKLDLQANQISSIEYAVFPENLNNLLLSGNPIRDIPIDDLNNTSAILGYLKSIRDNVAISNSHLKINIIGEGRIGKTQLFNFLNKEYFVKNQEETNGNQTARYRFNENFEATVWDFGGQTYHHGFHKIFLGRTDFNIVLWRSKHDTQPDYGYWLGTARSFSHDMEEENYLSPLFLVQNVWSSDGDNIFYPESTKIQKYQVRFDNIFVIDVKELFNKNSSWKLRNELFINQLHSEMEKHAQRLKIPQKWFNIKQKLDLKPIKGTNITKANFKQDWASEINDVNSFEGFLSYLTFTGNILYFSNNKLLSDYVFPNPPFLADWIYNNVLKTANISQQNGFLYIEQLAHQFSEAEITIFIELMHSFGLIFKLPLEENSETVYVIPQYLPEVEHSFKKVILDIIPFTFSLIFPDFFHEGRIFQFISKYGEYALDKTSFWKYGILYKHPISEETNNGLQVVVIYKSSSRQLIVHVEDKKAKSIVAQEIFDFFLENELNYNKKLDIPDSFVNTISNYSLNQETSALLAHIGVSEPTNSDVKRSYLSGLKTNDVHLSTGQAFFDVKETFENIKSQNYFSTCVDTQKRIKLDFMAVNLLSENSNRKLRVFFSYSHKDEEYRDELDVHFSMLKRSGRIETWHDRKIVAGENWDEKIKQELEQADIVLLMISPYFLNSDYIWENELGIIRERQKNKNDELKVIPIFTRPCDTTGFDQMCFQGGSRDNSSRMPWISACPTNGKDKDTLYMEITTEVRKAIESSR